MTFSGKDSDTQCRCDSLDDVRAFHEIGGAPYETQVSDDQNLTFEYAAAYFQARGAPFEAQWRAMKLIDADGLFTNLALLLSDQCRHSLHAAVFRGTEKIEFLDRVVFTGSLLKQFEEVCGYLRRFNGKRRTTLPPPCGRASSTRSCTATTKAPVRFWSAFSTIDWRFSTKGDCFPR